MSKTVLCTLKSTYRDDVDTINVEFWGPDYGIVIPGEKTTNGDWWIAAEWVIHNLKTGFTKVSFSVLPEEAFLNNRSFVEAVRDWRATQTT